MARSLNNLFAFFCVLPVLLFSQTVDKIYAPPDYKTREDFKHYKKRSQEVSVWQINQLKTGALMVRLRTNDKVINGLRKAGKEDLATVKEHEIYVLNKTIVHAYLKKYTFSKVYFFYSNSSDSLLKGARSGIFLDSNLRIDPTIKYEGDFYMIAEKDFFYSSSIGFVKEDTARSITETGNIGTDCAVVVKNKYGHQTKSPFPNRIHMKGNPSRISKVYEQGPNGNTIRAEIPFVYKKYDYYIDKFNQNLHKFYYTCKGAEINDPEIKPFLY